MDLNKLVTRQLIDIEFEINIENEDIFNYKQSIKQAKQFINLLKEDRFRDGKCKLEFVSDKWEFYNGISGTTEVMDFSFFESLIFLKHIDINMLKDVLKCWVLNRIANDGLSATSAETYLKYLAEAIKRTHGFSAEKIEDYYMYIMSLELADAVKRAIVSTVLNFISFYNDLKMASEYTLSLYQLLSNLKPTSKSRIIPSGIQILKFSNILDHFFSTADKTSREYLHFLPLLLWWKITTIIPLRPYEFCSISANCLIYQDEKCYLQLPRLKENGLKKNKNRKQIIDKILIPNYIESLILEYINAIKPYHLEEKRKSLISRFAYTKTLTFPSKGGFLKRDDHTFLTPDLQILIERFYSEIINKNYGITSTNLPPIGRKPIEEKAETDAELIRVRSIDTRHIAFINMLAQGWSKPEIARFGGHLVLETQANYQNHQEYWIEEETQQLMKKFKLGTKQNTQVQTNDTLDNYSLSMRLDTAFKRKFVLATVPAEATKMKLKIGYCTDPLQQCASHCLHCDYWRISREEFEEKQSELYDFIKECDNHLVESFAVLKDLQRIVFKGDINPNVANEILSTQKKIDDDIFIRASMLYNLEKNAVI